MVTTGSESWNEAAAGLLAARAIDEVAAADGELTLAELAKRLGTSEQHVARIVNRLVTHLGYLALTGSGTLVLTPKVTEMGDQGRRAELARAFSDPDT
jgi:DNA-binding IclR family transcriptional regulator